MSAVNTPAIVLQSACTDAVERSKFRFETLDGWRGIAAMAVALFHLVVYSHFSDMAFITHAWVMVDFFFVLSGFVITHAYFADLHEQHRFGYFMTRRIGRLWPLHIVTLLAMVWLEAVKFALVKTHLAASQPVFSSETGTSIWQLVENVFLVQSLGMNTTNTWNGPSWSISTEIWAYMAFAIVCVLPTKRLILAAAVLVILISAAMVLRYSPHYMIASSDFGAMRCLDGFFTGHLVYRLWLWKPKTLSHPVLAEIIALLLFVGYASIVEPDIWSMLAPLVFGVVIWVFAFEAGPISALMRTRAMRYLGVWSYSIYMVHYFILRVLEKVASQLSRFTAKPVWIEMTYVPLAQARENFVFVHSKFLMDLVVIAYIAIVLLTASITFRFIEDPARRYFNRLARRYFGSASHALDGEASAG